MAMRYIIGTPIHKIDRKVLLKQLPIVEFACATLRMTAPEIISIGTIMYLLVHDIVIDGNNTAWQASSLDFFGLFCESFIIS